MRGLVFLLLTLLSAETAALAGGACAHRGDHTNAPENTIPAIRSAVEKGAHQIEIDVQMSKDGKLVIMHDETVDRTTNGTGKVADLTFEELRKLDAGNWFNPAFKDIKIPTLHEALAIIPHKILCNVNIKDGPEISVPLAKAVAEMNRLDHCFLAIGGPQAQEACAAARAAVPDIMICTGLRVDETVTQETVSIKKEIMEQYRAVHPQKKIRGHIDIIQLFYWGTPVPYDRIKDAVRNLHRYGVTVNYCCASNEEGIRLLIEAGVDYILTDNLDLCLEIFDEYGVKPIKTKM